MIPSLLEPQWSDPFCERIVQLMRGPTTPGYPLLLILEFVLPVMVAEQREVPFGVVMMCLTGSERDEVQWDAVLGG